MANNDGYYYLHTNGELIFKSAHTDPADFLESDCVKQFWRIDTSCRETTWQILIEASVLGARPERIADLADKWGCDDTDADVYASRIGVEISLDGSDWCATGLGFINLEESAAGFGKTKLSALADFCRNLGYSPTKMWGHTFKSLLQAKDPANGQFGVGA